MAKFNDLRVLASGQFSRQTTADFMVIREAPPQRRALGWIYKTENGEFDARRFNHLEIGIYPDLKQAVYAIGETVEPIQPEVKCAACGLTTMSYSARLQASTGIAARAAAPTSTRFSLMPQPASSSP
jgi:hypothetical protein